MIAYGEGEWNILMEYNIEKDFFIDMIGINK